jgi:hypothetical protein
MQSIRTFGFEVRRTSVKVSCMGQAQRRTLNRAIISALLVRENDLRKKPLIFLEPD